MFVEQKRGAQPHLTATQEKVANQVINSVKSSSSRLLVVIEGLSGVGKSFVTEAITVDILANSGMLIEPRVIQYGDRDNSIKDSGKHLVTTATVGEFGDDVRKVALKNTQT